MKLKGRREHQPIRTHAPTQQPGVPQEELGSRGGSQGLWLLGAQADPTRRLGSGPRMAPRRAVRLSLREPTHAVCVVGVETLVDVYR